MKPIINPWLFYLIDKAEDIAYPLIFFGIMFWIAVALVHLPASGNEEWAINFFEKTKLIRIFLTIGLIIAMLLPSKETSYKCWRLPWLHLTILQQWGKPQKIS